jgi:hypothetical protein
VTDAPKDSLKQRALEADQRYALALRIARAHWPESTPPEVLAAVAATIYISLTNGKAATVAAARPTLPATAPVGVEAPPPPCPECGKPMRDQRATKRGNQPDYKCGPGCDGAVWLDRKRAAR